MKLVASWGEAFDSKHIKSKEEHKQENDMCRWSVRRGIFYY